MSHKLQKGTGEVMERKRERQKDGKEKKVGGGENNNPITHPQAWH